MAEASSRVAQNEVIWVFMVFGFGFVGLWFQPYDE
jgi:hypothetical protein